MKKSFLLLATAALLGLAACNSGGSGGGSGGGGGGGGGGGSTPEIPTEAGKLTLYFELGADSVALPEWCGYFVTGAFSGWKTAIGEAVELKQLKEGSSFYYGQFAVADSSTLTDKGFQLTIGYNAQSGAPSTGINWDYKSLECQAASGESGTENMNFILSEDGLSARLGEGTHHWEEALPQPVIVQNVTLSITFKEAAPEWVTVYAPGNYLTNWACSTADAMKPSEDRKTWTKLVPSIAVNSYAVQVIVEYTANYDNDKVKFSWSNKVVTDEYGGTGGNFSMGILRKHGNSTFSFNEACIDGADFEFDFAAKTPDPTKISKGNFKIELAEALDLTKNEHWYVIGSFTGWAPVEVSYSDDKKTLTASFDKMIWDTDAEFGICSDKDWHIAVKDYLGKVAKEEEGEPVLDPETGEPVMEDKWTNFKVTVPHVEFEVKITVDAENVALMNTPASATEWVNVTGVYVPANAE